MFPVYDVDAFLLLALSLASKRRPAELTEIIAAGDLIQDAVCSELDLSEAFYRLSVHGLICGAEGGYALTPNAQEIMKGQPKKAGAHERVFGIKGNLTAYSPKGEHPPVTVSVELLAAAVSAHQATKSSAGRNLFVPKPKPAETDPRRKPLPSRRR
jgi:hypothetical protein